MGSRPGRPKESRFDGYCGTEPVRCSSGSYVPNLLHTTLDPDHDVQYDPHIAYPRETVPCRDFTPGELKVMRLLWEHGELKPADLQAVSPSRSRTLPFGRTSRPCLEKGHVTRRRVGKVFLLQAGDAPVLGVPDDARSNLTETFCGGWVQRS